jgi:hypothetical protein
VAHLMDKPYLMENQLSIDYLWAYYINIFKEIIKYFTIDPPTAQAIQIQLRKHYYLNEKSSEL